jgi:hypothetical protein
MAFVGWIGRLTLTSPAYRMVTHRELDSLRAATEAWWQAFPDIALEGAEYWAFDGSKG